MKKLIALLLLVSANVHAWDSSSAYNTVAMSYTANSTITQTIVLNAAQQSQSSVNFVVDVKNGGGRPTQDPVTLAAGAYASQTDTASVTMYLYSATGSLITSVTSQNYVLQNWGSDPSNHFSTKPGDNLWAFTQASVAYNGSLANVGYIKIEMKGTDGAWWAGNYGPQWRTPTVTVGSDTTNVVYNSEFGIAPNGVQAQGWVANNGQGWSNCGVTSGSLLCVTQEAGVTANMWGGGYDAAGGTTSGQAGGYSGTLTSSNATQAASGTIAPGGGGSTPSPPPFDGTLTQSNAPTNQTVTSGTSSTAGPSATQQTTVTSRSTTAQTYQNILYIDQSYGQNNSVDVSQQGPKNRIDFTMNGNGNVVSSSQAGSNYMKTDIPGWGNNVTTIQSNTSGYHYAETKIQGNGNTVNHTQTGNASQILFNTSQGDINNITTLQSGSAAHFVESKLQGNFHNVRVDQQGGLANKANIELTNSGGAGNIDLQQLGGKSVTVIQNCANSQGCGTTIRQ